MKFLLIIIVALTAPGLCAAQSFPALYDIQGVEPDDLLNVRSGPDASSEIIGGFAPDETDIEVVELDASGTWGHVNFGDRAGWVSMRFLEPALQPGISLLPRPLICFGTEPFWKLDISNGPIAELGRLGHAPRRFTGIWTIRSANMSGRYALMGENPDTDLIAVVNRELCSDGMSDRLYGLRIDLVLALPDETQLYSGCCSISP